MPRKRPRRPLMGDIIGRIALAAAVAGEIVLPLHILPPASAQHGASWAGGVVMVVGIALAFSAEQTLMRAGTTTKFFSAPKVLVSHGPYRFSRNPFYLGFMLFIGGFLLMLSFDWVLLVLPAWFFAMARWSVPDEEKRLEKVFGDDWRAYAARVRRWI